MNIIDRVSVWLVRVASVLVMVHITTADSGWGLLWLDPRFDARETAIIEHALIEWASVTPDAPLLRRQNIDIVICPDIEGLNYAGAHRGLTICLFRDGLAHSSRRTGADRESVFTHVVMHELGHAHGLAHAADDECRSVMTAGWLAWSMHLTDADVEMVATVR